jgi:hypothetical protein
MLFDLSEGTQMPRILATAEGHRQFRLLWLFHITALAMSKAGL